MAPQLVVVVDTEEDWFEDWSRPVALENLSALDEVHARLYESLDVRPTYLITYPVARHAKTQAFFRELAESGRGEIGAHVHNWTSPPFTDADKERRSYHSALPADEEKQKIADLVEAIRDGIGVDPVSFKGGRWGANGRTIQNLHELGLRIDTSVCPVTDFRPFQGGPDYTDAPFDCYFPSWDDLLTPDPNANPSDAVLEIPVTVGFARKDFEGQRELYKSLVGNPVLRRVHAVGILHRLGVLRRIKLSPEQSTLAEMRQLVDAALERGQSVLNLTFHSCVLSRGTSPYSMTEADHREQLDRIEGILDHIVRVRGVVPATCSEVRDAFALEPAE
jgi:hypothetical protein